ncbi:MAG: alcohol dehydrogenase catalytic domain-containing protein [Alphaproteobacteria bacterium]|nr:alcohol dehydrogenase catalytic domain-containing protein [Alphaproteobacteria bacterium]
MRALVYTGPEAVELQDVAGPSATPGDVVVQVDAVGICGSDMHAFLGHDERRPAPLILGHEASGTIVQGAGEGRRVTINPLVTCGTCEACVEGRANLCPDRQIISMPPREGAFAEQLAIPAGNSLLLPDDLSFAKAALTEPMACSYHAVRLAAEASHRPLAEARAIVLGGGAIGLGAALVLADMGCSDIWIAETNALRHGLLGRAGNFKVYSPLEGAGPEEASAHVVVDAFGGEATRASSSALVKPGGVIVHIGLASGTGGLDVRRMTLQEVTFIGTYTFTPADFAQTLNAIATGRLGPLDWVEERGLEEGPGAFRDILSGKAAHPKIMFRL